MDNVNATAEVGNTAEAVESTEVPLTSDEGVEATTNPHQEPEGSQEAFEALSIDDLLGADVESYDEFHAEENHKGMRPLHELMKHLPEDARKHLANLRASYTQKTQEIAEVRKELEAQRAAHKAEQDGLYNGEFAKNVAEMAAEPEKPYDIWDEDGMKMKIKQEAAKMFEEMLNPLQKQMRESQRDAELASFKAAHPDLTGNEEIKMEVARMLVANEHLSLENAYFIVKGKNQKLQAQAAANAEREDRAARRAVLAKTSAGTNTRGGVPKFRNAIDAFNYYKANPDAVKNTYSKMKNK